MAPRRFRASCLHTAAGGRCAPECREPQGMLQGRCIGGQCPKPSPRPPEILGTQQGRGENRRAGREQCWTKKKTVQDNSSTKQRKRDWGAQGKGGTRKLGAHSARQASPALPPAGRCEVLRAALFEEGGPTSPSCPPKPRPPLCGTQFLHLYSKGVRFQKALFRPHLCLGSWPRAASLTAHPAPGHPEPLGEPTSSGRPGACACTRASLIFTCRTLI